MGTPTDAEIAYRAAIERSLVGRTASGVARAAGLPKDCIRDVLQGRTPEVGRANAICRALGITFVLGAGEGESDDEAPPQGGASVRREPLRDLHLAEVLSRLLDLWERTPKAERAGLTLAMSSFLDLIGAQDGAADGAERGRTVAAVSWRVDRESDPDDSTDTSGVVSPGTCPPRASAGVRPCSVIPGLWNVAALRQTMCSMASTQSRSTESPMRGSIRAWLRASALISAWERGGSETR